jgi:D-3-phosphoglycerate dehydrogenase
VPSTAEETFALILALVRNIPWSFDYVKNGGWNRLEWRGHQLMNKTIGLLGFGRLGRIVARYAKAFNMKILACDPNVSGAFMKSRGATKVDMEELFKKSDIVSLHVLLTDETQNLVKEKHLKSMKPMAYLINTARAELIEKGVLEKALKNKWLAGAGVDVMWDEEGDGSHLKNNPLLEYAKKNKNLIILPHIGGATFEAMETTQDYIAELVKNVIIKTKK